MGKIHEPPMMLDSQPIESKKLMEAIIIAALKQENISTVGICGSGGIVEARFVSRIGEKVRRDKLFNVVAMGSSSATPNEMLSYLITKEKILIILDDDSVILDAEKEKVRILFLKHNNGSCKIMITSRFKRFLTAMGARKIFTAKCLEKEEVWILFRDKVGDNGETCNLYSLARSVVKEFRGLTLDSNLVDRMLNEKREVWLGTLEKKTRNP